MKIIHTKDGRTLYKDDNGHWLKKGEAEARLKAEDKGKIVTRFSKDQKLIESGDESAYQEMMKKRAEEIAAAHKRSQTDNSFIRKASLQEYNRLKKEYEDLAKYAGDEVKQRPSDVREPEKTTSSMQDIKPSREFGEALYSGSTRAVARQLMNNIEDGTQLSFRANGVQRNLTKNGNSFVDDKGRAQTNMEVAGLLVSSWKNGSHSTLAQYYENNLKMRKNSASDVREPKKASDILAQQAQAAKLNAASHQDDMLKEYQKAYQNQLSASSEKRMKELEAEAKKMGYEIKMTNYSAQAQKNSLAAPQFEMKKLEPKGLDNFEVQRAVAHKLGISLDDEGAERKVDCEISKMRYADMEDVVNKYRDFQSKKNEIPKAPAGYSDPILRKGKDSNIYQAANGRFKVVHKKGTRLTNIPGKRYSEHRAYNYWELTDNDFTHGPGHSRQFRSLKDAQNYLDSGEYKKMEELYKDHLRKK